MNVPPWDPEAEDRRIRSERAARDRISRRTAPVNKGANTTVTYTDRAAPRGVLTPEEVERRKQADRAMRIRARNQTNAAAPRLRPWPLPEPKRKPNGRWLARVVHHRRVYQRTFDTKRQARDFIRAVTSTKEDS